MIRQILNELYKLIFLNRGYVILILFLLINLYHIDNNNTVIMNKFTAENEKALDEMFARFGDKYDTAKSKGIEEYYASAVSNTDDEYLKKHKSVIRYYYKAYIVPRDSEHTDRIVDARGYEVILNDYASINVWMLLISLIITAMVFGSDKARGQEDIVKTTLYGHKKVIVAKLIFVTVIITLMELIRFACVYIGVRKNFDIADMSVPLQNLNYMHDVAIDINVGQAMIFVVLAQIVGLIMTNAVCAFWVTGANKAAAGFFWGFALSYVPFFLLNTDKFYRKLPLPAAYLAPYNFLDSIEQFRDMYLITVGICVVMYIVIYKIYVGGKMNGRT